MERSGRIFARRLFVAVLAAGILVGGWACGGSSHRGSSPKTDVATVSTQSVILSAESIEQGVRDTLHFGRMRQGEIIRKQLRIENQTESPIVILRHSTSCGCTTVNYERRPIAAGGSTIVDFEFNSRGEMGWQMKLMEFYFAEKDSPLKIYIEAEVE